MANMMLCSAVGGSDLRQSLGTMQMRENCMAHLAETIRVLEPTLVINQGVGVGKALEILLFTDHEHWLQAPAVGNRLSRMSLAEVAFEGRRFAWVDLHHPSRGGWSSPRSGYAQEAAIPALELGRELALELARAED